MEPNFIQQNQKAPEVEKPEDKLKSALGKITDARIKEDRAAEKIACSQANAVYKQITGEDLLQKALAQAKAEVESEGFKILPKIAASPQEKLEAEVLKFKVDQQPFGLQRGWALLSEEEKKDYQNDYNLFVANVEKAREKLEKQGTPISREIFYNMIGSGYIFSDLRKNFLSGGIKLPVLVGEGVYKFNAMSGKQFDNLVNLLQSFMDLIARKAMFDQMNKKEIYKQKRWHERKMRKIREILLAKINEIETGKKVEQTIKIKVQEQLEAERKKEEQKNPDISGAEAISKFKTLERQEQAAEKELGKELRKMERRLEKDVQSTGQSQKEIGKLEKEHKKVVKISQKKAVFKKAIEQNKAP